MSFSVELGWSSDGTEGRISEMKIMVREIFQQNTILIPTTIFSNSEYSERVFVQVQLLKRERRREEERDAMIKVGMVFLCTDSKQRYPYYQNCRTLHTTLCEAVIIFKSVRVRSCDKKYIFSRCYVNFSLDKGREFIPAVPCILNECAVSIKKANVFGQSSWIHRTPPANGISG